MKSYQTLLLVLLNLGLYAQSSLCTPDPQNEEGQLLAEIISESESGETVKDSHNRESYSVRRLCRASYVRMERLNKLLSDEQIDELFACDNAALKSVGFILYCKRREKKAVLKRFLELLDEDIAFMASDCTDYAITTSFQQFCFDIIKRQNRFFQPYFKLSKKEESILTRSVLNYEANFWKR